MITNDDGTIEAGQQAGAFIRAIHLVEHGHVSRVDGEGFKVYRVGELTRIDIQPKERTNEQSPGHPVEG